MVNKLVSAPSGDIVDATNTPIGGGGGGPAAATKEFNVAVGSPWPAGGAKVATFTFTNVPWEVFHIELT